MRQTIASLAILLLSSLSSLAQPASPDSFAAEWLQKANRSARTLVAAIGRGNGCNEQSDPLSSWDKQYNDYRGDMVLAEGTSFLQRGLGIRQSTIAQLISIRFQVADYALKMNCLNVADEEYRSIVKDTGSADDPKSRERARIGIDDVRERRRGLQQRQIDADVRARNKGLQPKEFDLRFSFPKE